MEKEDELEEAEIMDNLENSDREKMDLIDNEARCVWNEADNSVDMGRVRATDLRGNKRICLPQPLDPKKEGLLQARAALWKDVIHKYRNEHCRADGKQKQILDKELMIGISKLKKRSGKKAEIITVSDKGNDLVVSSLDVYTKQVEEQTVKDKIIDRKNIIEVERRLNMTVRNFTNTFGTGLVHGERNRKRIWDNSTNVGEAAALVNISTKTHKPIPPSGIPKSRAITDAGECSTAQLGNSVAMLLEAITKSNEWDGESLSTQHQIAMLRQLNQNMAPYNRREWQGDPTDVTGGGDCIFSGNVEALFPSLDKEVCAQVA